MTSNAGGRNDRPTLPPPFGGSRQGAAGGTQPPPKSNPSMPLAQPPRSQGATQPPRLGAPPPSQPLPLPAGAPQSGTLTAVTPPMGPGTLTDVSPAADEAGMGHITAVSPPPIGAPPPSQPLPALGAPPPSQPFPAMGPPPPSQPFAPAGPRPHSPSQPFPAMGPPPPSQPFAPAGPRRHSPSQQPFAQGPASGPVSGRSHSATQPPAHGTSQAVPIGPPGAATPAGSFPPPGHLGPPPPSQPFAPVSGRRHSPSQQPFAQGPASGPVSGRSHSATQPPAHGTSQAVPIGPTGSSPSNPIPLVNPLGPPPPSGPISALGSPGGGRSHSATQPPPTRTHSTTHPPPLGPPPPSQPFSAAQRQGTPAQSMPPITTDQTHLGIPSAPQGKAAAWAPQPAQPTVEMPPPGHLPSAGDEPVGMSAPIAPGGAALPTGSAQAGLVAVVRRAFRLRVEPADVQPDEAKALEVAGIHDAHHRAFLAWRRSVLLVSAALFVPLALFRLIEVLRMGDMPGALQALQLLPSLAEGAVCALLWMQLRNWTRWQGQRRLLLLGWAGAFLVPFVVFLYPVDGAVKGPGGSGDFAFLLNSAYALQAVLVVGPKVISLMPGAMRASMVAKLLFPGSAAPGWLVVLSAPIAALLLYVVFLVPYQVTGSGYFILALAGLIAAQFFLGRAALGLARPSTQLDALSLIGRVRTSYLISLGVGVLFAVIALTRLSSAVHLGGLSVLVALLSFGSNALLLSLVGADLVVSNMEGARTISVDAQAAVAETQQRLSTFVRESTPGTNVMR